MSAPLRDAPIAVDGDLALTPYEPEDAAALAALGDDLEVARMMTSIRLPFTEAAAAARIASAPWAGTAGFLAALRHRGRLVGEAGIAPDDDRSVMYWLGARHRGQGLGRRALGLVLEVAFRHLALAEVVAESYDDNPASIAVIEGAGFERAGEGIDADHHARTAPARYLCYRLSRAAWQAREDRR